MKLGRTDLQTADKYVDRDRTLELHWTMMYVHDHCTECKRLKHSMFGHGRINQRQGLYYNRRRKIIKVSGSSRGEVPVQGFAAGRMGL
jgi:hypothetical protein